MIRANSCIAITYKISIRMEWEIREYRLMPVNGHLTPGEFCTLLVLICVRSRHAVAAIALPGERFEIDLCGLDTLPGRGFPTCRA